MRIMPLLKAACLSLMLSACVAPLLMMSPTSQLMWALLKPLVGFDPNEANLFEQPLIKDRMTAMLGPNYDSTMQLLKTANELQQEGPLFYVVSRYAPVPDVAKQAGMVWNADTNQLSVMLQKGDGATQVFGENLTAATPTWPSAMQEWQAGNPTATALTDAGKVMTGTSGSLLGNMMGNLQQSATQALTDSTSQVIGSATASAQQQASKAVSDSAKQAVGSATTSAQQQASKAVSDSATQTVSDATDLLRQTNQAVSRSAQQAVSDTAKQAAASAQQQAGKVVSDTAKQAATSAQQQASKAVSDSATQAATSAAAKTQQQVSKVVSGASGTVQAQAGKVETRGMKQSDQARADAEAELEKLLN
ncbi:MULTISPECIES: hypothetical protein [Aeromonas]|uniref:hypothetical protein n=1 Tax=Aeromonas TaxID=642 RepID=UPI002973AAD8|nr:hypothetical protein [Aeromonas rivipollensis]